MLEGRGSEPQKRLISIFTIIDFSSCSFSASTSIYVAVFVSLSPAVPLSPCLSFCLAEKHRASLFVTCLFTSVFGRVHAPLLHELPPLFSPHRYSTFYPFVPPYYMSTKYHLCGHVHWIPGDISS